MTVRFGRRGTHLAPTIFLLDHEGIIQDVTLNRMTSQEEFKRTIAAVLRKGATVPHEREKNAAMCASGKPTPSRCCGGCG